MRPVCPDFLAVLAPCLLVGRMLGPGWLVHFRRIGLDQPIGVPSDAVTERDNRRGRFAAGLASWSSFLVAMESGAACGRTSAPPEPAVLAGRESPRGADPGQGAFLTPAVSGSARPCPSWVYEGYISALASQCAALPGSSGTRHGPAWTAAGTPGAPYGGKQGCAPTAASPRAAVRKIGLVPSKIVKILDYGTISAGQRPVRGRDISTDPARAVRGWRRFGRGPRRHRSPTLPQVHLRYICALTCQYSSCRRDVALRQHDLGRAATMGHTRAGCADTVSIPDRSSSGRHGGTTGRTGHNAPGPAYTAVMVLPVRAAYGRVSESFPELAPAVVEHANPGRIDIVRVKRHLLGQLGDGLPHRCRRLAGVRCRGKRRLAAGGRVPSGGEQLDLEVPGEHLDEIQCLGYGLEIAPGPAPEGVGRDAERGADGDLAPCEVAWAPRR